MSEPSQYATAAANAITKDRGWFSTEKNAQIIQAEMDKACAEKDKKIAELQEAFAMSQAARKEWMAVFDGYKLTIVQQQQRLSEARFLIERIGTVDVGQGCVIRAAARWLEKPI